MIKYFLNKKNDKTFNFVMDDTKERYPKFTQHFRHVFDRWENY